MIGSWSRLLVTGVLIASIFALLVGLRSEKDDEKRVRGKEISFSKDIYPILKTHCQACHVRENEHPSEFYIDTYEDMMGESRHGKTIVPGNALKSIFYQKLLPNPPFGRTMPPSKKIKLTEEQIELFKRWVNQGAKKN
jgi:hypothetical protein